MNTIELCESCIGAAAYRDGLCWPCYNRIVNDPANKPTPGELVEDRLAGRLPCIEPPAPIGPSQRSDYGSLSA